MNCTRLKRSLSAYIDGELSGSDMLAARDHLRYCGACQCELDEVRSVKQALSALAPAPPSAYLEQRLLAALDACEIPLHQKIKGYLAERFNLRLEPAVAAVAACAGMFLLALGNLPQSPESYDTAAMNSSSQYAPAAPIAAGYVSFTSAEALAADASRAQAGALGGSQGQQVQDLGLQSFAVTHGATRVVPVAYAGVYDR